MSILDLEFRPKCSGANARPFKHSEVAYINGNTVIFKGMKRPNLYLSDDDFVIFLQDYQSFVGYLIDQQRNREKQQPAIKEDCKELANESNHAKPTKDYSKILEAATKSISFDSKTTVCLFDLYAYKFVEFEKRLYFYYYNKSEYSLKSYSLDDEIIAIIDNAILANAQLKAFALCPNINFG